MPHDRASSPSILNDPLRCRTSVPFLPSKLAAQEKACTSVLRSNGFTLPSTCKTIQLHALSTESESGVRAMRNVGAQILLLAARPFAPFPSPIPRSSTPPPVCLSSGSQLFIIHSLLRRALLCSPGDLEERTADLCSRTCHNVDAVSLPQIYDCEEGVMCTEGKG
ncbi:hypothetical protein CALVIDRAFT_412433 [Calocera viscosa TUFC12733]|uniref:Uncharacterized protein n=1 Tax=Calocera viscosa (strain TUFC12733) TaxID=1330018 RepID=A0A167G5H8_CALVF|nr:hypothetical protein CALVIDRAFT_412433 [Calocera viscosa TUFC12733]